MRYSKTKREKVSRINSHKIEDKSKNRLNIMIDDLGNGDILMLREVTGRDYGYDFILEIFENDEPTRKISFIQLKGTNKKIEKLKGSDFVSCPNVSKSSLKYVRQSKIPFILIYLSLKTKSFYFENLLNRKQEMNGYLNSNNDKFSIRVSALNHVESNMDIFYKMINEYYN